MYPQFTLISIAVALFLLTVGTIWHVVLIDVKYMKERGLKNKALNIIIWMSVVGVMVNAPVWYILYQNFGH